MSYSTHSPSSRHPLGAHCVPSTALSSEAVSPRCPSWSWHLGVGAGRQEKQVNKQPSKIVSGMAVRKRKQDAVAGMAWWAVSECRPEEGT